ncbi:MAG: phosphatase [Bacteroidetes bacterium]|nr:phosphatase [Bacteroidota bacterium]
MDLQAFTALGTRFLRPQNELVRRASGIRAVLFDWDGVFNDGWKDLEGGSPFSEVGSLGVNMLRFALWLKDGALPTAAVITGQHNGHAERFVQRERFHGLYMGFINKPDAFEHFLRTYELVPEQVAFFFDDAIDLPVARRCGLRVMIGRSSGPLFTEHVIARGDADIITAHSGGANGLREATELVIGLLGRVAEVIDHRAAYTDTYQRYLQERNATTLDVQRSRS